jgi:hypothetical protein
MTTRAAREAASLALLGAPQARRNLPERAFADALEAFSLKAVPAALRGLDRQLCSSGCCRSRPGFELTVSDALQSVRRAAVCATCDR